MTRPDDTVTVTTVIALDPEIAFEVFTREIDAWWKQGPAYRVNPQRPSTMRFEPGVGGRLLEVYEGDDDAFELGRIRVWEPAGRLVFGMGGRDFAKEEDWTEVDVRFERVADGTRVTVEHRGWADLPEGHPARHGLEGTAFAGVMGVWWGDLLNALGRHATEERT